MKRGTLLLTFSAFFLGGVFVFSQLGSSDDAASSMEDISEAFVQDTNPLTVEYTDDGYIPDMLSIEKGETVTFVNKSSRSMWVASDNHPTHTIYPEFDQKGLSRTGETYAFTFENLGQWAYHDHINPSADGLIIVN